MEELDVLFVEDLLSYHSDIASNLNRYSLTNLGVRSLEAFEEAIQNSVRARVYVIDGRFPFRESDLDTGSFEIPFCGAEAISLIQRQVDQNARIIFYSAGDDSLTMANRMGVEWVDKKDTSLESLIQKIKELLAASSTTSQ